MFNSLKILSQNSATSQKKSEALSPSHEKPTFSTRSTKLHKVLESISKGANQNITTSHTYASTLSARAAQAPALDKSSPHLPAIRSSPAPGRSRDLDITLNQRDRTKPALSKLSLAHLRTRINDALEMLASKPMADT
jgi:hypothetical protein